MSQQASGRPGAANADISAADYNKFKAFLEQACGILLGDSKQYLVTSRLNKLIKQHDITSLGELVNKMQHISQSTLKQAVIDAMTTNETLWFRDTYPFEILKQKLLPEFQQSTQNSNIRIWSAACSSGQEPYSLSMIVEEYRSASGLKKPVEIVATELSNSMLECCRQAEYNALSLNRGLTDARLKRFFEPVGDNVYRVKSEVRQRVQFQALNLMESYSRLGKFDIVFCRNVLIYFSADLKADILRRIHSALRPGGYVVLGASEGMTEIGKHYEMVQCNPGIIYRAL